MITTRIIGTGSALPVHTLTNDDLSKFLDTSDEWIRTRTGICTRQLAGDGESTVTLAVEAGKKALLNSGVSPEEIQMVLVATCSSENYFPSVGCRVQEALGLTHASAMDLSAACSGFLFALHTAHAYIVSGYCRTVLVIGAETLSRTIDWSDRSTCVLFGDGAGACVVRGEETGLIQILQHSDGTKGDVLMANTRRTATPVSSEREGMPLSMDGQEKELRKENVYANVSLDEKTGEIIIKAVNRNAEPKEIALSLAEGCAPAGSMKRMSLSGKEEDYNCIIDPEKVTVQTEEAAYTGKLELPAYGFVVARIPVKG